MHHAAAAQKQQLLKRASSALRRTPAFTLVTVIAPKRNPTITWGISIQCWPDKNSMIFEHSFEAKANEGGSQRPGKEP